MAENSLSQVTPTINENRLKYVEHEGQIFFSSEEIGRQLGYAKPSRSINILYSRNQRELDGYARHIKMMCRDGQNRETRCFTEEGVYILSMLANTPQARDFRARLARLLRELREQRVTLARESAYRQGYDEGRASALPDLLDAEARARRETLHLVWALGPVQKRLMRRALRYRSLGLSRRETARLLGISPRHTQELLKMADALGMDFPALPVQGSLLEGMA